MSVTAPGGSTRPATRDGSSHTHYDGLTVGWRPDDGDVVDLTMIERESVDERNRARPPRKRDGFTMRQREILALVATGSSNAEIAERLGISRRTVEKHVEAIHTKAGTATRARLVAFAASQMRPENE